MIDERFSADAFAALGPSTPAAEVLSHTLGSEMADAVRSAVEDTIQRMVEQLRGMGHDLQEWERSFQPSFHSRGYSFGPGDPAPPGGWLAVHFNTSAFVMFGRAEPEPAAVVEGQSGGEQPSATDWVPF